MQNLRELLTATPIEDTGPMFPSIRAAALRIASLHGNNKFEQKPDSANAALNAVVRGDRPFTAEMKEILLRAIEDRINEFQAGTPARRSAEQLSLEIEMICSTERRSLSNMSLGENNLPFVIKRFEDTKDAFMIRPVPRPGIVVETHPMRRAMFEKLGMYKSAKALGKTHSGLTNFASARLSFVVASEEHALKGWESFLMQAIGAQSGHPLGAEESLEVDEALARIHAIEDADLLRIYVADPALCITPLQVHNPGSDSLADGWIIYYLPGESTITLQMPADYLQEFQESVFRRIENETLPSIRRARWQEGNRDNIIGRARSLKLLTT